MAQLSATASHFDCDGRVVSVSVKPKIWKKLEDAATNYPMWVAAIGGKMGESTSNGFVLLDPSIQPTFRTPNWHIRCLRG
ncbi:MULTISPECIES: hypothetical protein [unclassified Microcoleus]|uniref:hypothetical protein n=1 Tax=unclassified Microcoleus TaxID=2642155 RepID=UPI002FD4DABD